jgi:hypothetical protein
MNTIKQTVEQMLDLAKSTLSTRRELAQTKQQLEQSRRFLELATQHYDQLNKQNRKLSKRNDKLSNRLSEVRRQLRNVARAYVLCRVPKRSMCAEIGVHEGEFSEQILNTVDPEKLHLIDPWKQGDGLFGKQAARDQAILDERYAKVTERFAEEIEASRVRIHRNLSSEIVGEFDDSYFDWIYVDGNHLYEYVKQDLELYFPKVKNGGYLTGDDYGVSGLWDNGVQQAVNEFCRQRPECTLEVHGSQFIIRKETQSD